MTDIRASHPTLEDSSTGAGLPLHKVLEGDAAASKNASAALVAKDPTNNLIYLATDASGRLKITGEATTANLSGTGVVAGNAAFTTIATITLQNSKVYEDIAVVVGCFRDTEYEIAWNDATGPTETVIARGLLTGAGQLSLASHLNSLSFTSAVAGAQTLYVKGKNMNVVSEMKATISVKERQ